MVARSVVVNAPVDRVFSYVADPSNLSEFISSFEEVRDVQPLPGGGHRFRWVYKMAGMRFEGTAEDIAYTPSERVATRFTGGIESTNTYTCQAEADGTRVSFTGDYKLPIPLLGRLAEAVIVKVNEHEAEAMLANLKTRLEA